MGLFWDYFRDNLRVPFLGKRGALPVLAQGVSACLDTVREVVLLLRDQFLPARCEDIYLERFAASRGIVRHPMEPVEYWQARTRFAYLWWSRGGRPSALSESLCMGFGFDSAEVINLRTENPALWATFRVVVEGGAGDVMLHLEHIKWAINEVKRASSKLEKVDFYAPTHKVQRYSGIACFNGAVSVIYPYSPQDLTFETTQLWHAVSCRNGALSTIYPGEE